MRAEVIASGDELASGQRLDTNSQWLSQRLGELGVPVVLHTTCGDDLTALVGVLRTAIDRAEVVIATGGLGPTADDLMREALARAVDRELVLDEAALEQIRQLFARRRREMPERNRVQAMFPRGSRPIDNPHGTAPGIQVEAPRLGRAPAHVFCLPGVPAEMRSMWQQGVADRLMQLPGVGQRAVCHHRIKCFGRGESHVEAQLPDLIRRGRVPSVGITAHQATITLRITAAGATPEAARAAMQPTINLIHQRLGSLVFGEGNDEMHHAVAKLLLKKSKTLATVEWGTGGIIAQWLHEVLPSDGPFRGGVVARSSSALQTLLGIDQAVSQRHGPVSDEVSRRMAASIRERVDSDFGLAVSRFPRFQPDAKSPPEWFIALADRQSVEIVAVPFAGHPDILHVASAKRALDLLRLRLLRL